MITRVKTIEVIPLFPYLYKTYLEPLKVGEFVYLHKEINHKNCLHELSGDLRAGFQRRNVNSHFEREVIYDPDTKSAQKVLKVTKIK